MNALWFWLVRFSRRLLVRASLYALFAVAIALIAVWFAPLVPDDLAERLGGDAVEGVLSALATSLLAVTTFSASAIVVAYTAASAQLTPRAASFITADAATQRPLATFIGAFLFTIVALVALGANYYGPAGRTIIFLATLLMVAIVAVTLLGWIDQVSRLALHSRLLGEIESATRAAMKARRRKPCLGGGELKEESATGAVVRSRRSGYVANIDPGKLQAIAEELGCTVEALILPGAFAHEGQPVLRLPDCDAVSDGRRDDLLGAFVFRNTRTFEQDPEYGFQVLVEIAARALSPGVNDPGTAVLAIDSCYRLLGEWIALRAEDPPEPTCSRVRARDLDDCALVQGSLGEIGRYGAGDVMVAERVLQALDALARAGDGALAGCAREAAGLALARAEAVLPMEADRRRVRAAAESDQSAA